MIAAMCKTVLVFLTLTSISAFIQAQKTTRSQTFSIVQRHVLLNSAYASIATNDLQLCAQECLRDIKCKSANFNKKNQMCTLNDLCSVASERLILHQDFIFISATVAPDSTVNLKSSSSQLDRTEKTCKEIYSSGRASGNGEYSLLAKNGTIFQVYCHMDSIPGCGGGGWSLAMKIDGRRSTFAYSSKLWSNKVAHNPAAARTGLLDNQETKTPVYWSSNVAKLCLGMRPTDNASNITFISFVTPYTVRSLFDVIADGKYRATTLGRTKWLMLLSDSSLQSNCNGEGFNTRYGNFVRARIGILGNQENDCKTPDSFLGFGTGGKGCGADFSDLSCGNGAPAGCGISSHKSRKTFAYGYILIQ